MKTILACVDYSDVSEAVVDMATGLAKATGGPLCLLHVVAVPMPAPDTMIDPVLIHDEQVHMMQGYMAKLTQRAAQTGIHCEPVWLEGPAAANILDEARARDAGVVVMGSHGHGALYHLLMGSTSQEVLRKASCPVMIVPSRVAVPAPEPAGAA